jgi:hypothetical protein
VRHLVIALAGQPFTSMADGFATGLVGTIGVAIVDGATIIVAGRSATDDLVVETSPSVGSPASPTTADLAAEAPAWAADSDGRYRTDFADPSGIEGDFGYDPGTLGMSRTRALALLARAERDVVGVIGPINPDWDSTVLDAVSSLILHRAVYLGALGKSMEDPAMGDLADRMLKLLPEDKTAALEAISRWDASSGETDISVVPVGRYSSGICEPLARPRCLGVHDPFPNARSAYWLLGPGGIMQLVVPS